MSVVPGEEQFVAPAAPVPQPAAMRRFLLRWGITFGFILVAFVATVATLNSTFYSAPGFAGSYLSALARHDVSAALGIPGVAVTDDTASDLLAADALGELSDIRLVSDTDRGDGRHHLVYAFDLSGRLGRSAFDVERSGTLLGFFSSWTFAASPTAVLEITPENDPEFEANGMPIDSAGGIAVPVDYAVLVPGVFSLAHESTFFEAAPAPTLVFEPSVTVRASVDVRANAEFVDLVQTQLDDLLADCATQTVLQPTGCPFGTRISNRVEDVPEWTIPANPDIEIEPGPTPGSWQVPRTAGTAHLAVDVRSLFDGTVSRLEEDVPFSIGYLIEFDDSGRITITEQ